MANDKLKAHTLRVPDVIWDKVEQIKKDEGFSSRNDTFLSLIREALKHREEIETRLRGK